jgi:sugar lactone lactonase YvrE
MALIDPEKISYFGEGLQRPECVLTTARGEVFACDRRGGISLVRQRAAPRLFLVSNLQGFLPNGFALMPDRSFLVANLGDEGGVWKLTVGGQNSLYLMEVDGQKLTSVNFIRLIELQRVWISISSRKMPRELAFNREVADGYIVLSDRKGARIVADNLAFTNELILDPTGQWLYVNETMGRRLTRLRLKPDGSLGDREIVTEFGEGIFPDGLADDAEGGLWITSVVSNRVIRLLADGSRTVIVDDSEPETVKKIETRFAENRFGRQEIDIGSRRRLRNVSSLAFGGFDLRTVYLGSTHGERLATFRSPFRGAEPVHWKF